MGLHHAVITALPTDDPAAFPALAHHHEQAGSAGEAAEWHYRAGESALARYDLSAAEGAFRSAVRLGSPGTRLKARFQLGYNVLRVLVRLDEAAVEAESELAEARALGDGAAETRALRSLAAYAFEAGRFDEARTRFEECLSLDRARQNARGVMFAAFNLASVTRGLGRPGDALTYLDEAMAAARAQGIEVPDLLESKAGCHHELGQLDVAEALYREAMTQARAQDDRYVLAFATANLSNLLGDLGRLEEARAGYAEALSMHRATGWKFGEAQMLSQYGDLLRATGDAAAAVEACERGVALWHELGDPRWEVRARLALAAALEAVGRDEDASAALSGVETEDARVRRALFVARARAARRANRLDEAARVLELARAAEDDVALEIEETWLRIAAGEAPDLGPVERAVAARRDAVQRRLLEFRVEELREALSIRS